MKKEITFLIILILVAGISFYVGMEYQQKKLPQRAFFQREGAGQSFNQIRERMLSGEVISKDEKSLTLKLVDGSTRIVFISESTKVSKMTDGSLNDVQIGNQVMIVGNQTTEGTFLAEQIQISPRMFQRR